MPSSLRPQAARWRWRCTAMRRGVTVTVRDDGPGMDEATQARVFDQFYQGDTSHKTEGNGLGLAMAQKIAALHGGRITVQSAPGRGSAFTVRLPQGGG